MAFDTLQREGRSGKANTPPGAAVRLPAAFEAARRRRDAERARGGAS